MSKWIEKNNEMMRRDSVGQLSLHKDKEAIELYLQHVDSKTKKFTNEINRLRYLVEEGYYIDVFEQYNESDLIELTEYAYSFNFEFQSFMAASKFYETYALKTRDKKQWLENFEQHNVIVSLYLANGDVEQAKKYIKTHTLQTVQTATPTYLNAGRKQRGELASCYLFTMDDTLNSINFIRGQVSQASKIAGGVAVNLTRLRGRGAPIKGIKNAAKGVFPVAKLIEGEVGYADQMGSRDGAGAAYLNIFHSDVIELLNSKKINADEGARLATLSIGLIVPSLFFDLAKDNKDLYMFEPYSIEKEYGVILDDINIAEWYDKLVENENIVKKKMNARDMLNMIAQTQLQSGYPYIMYKDNANKNHALNEHGEVKMSNLCTEIFQYMNVSEINDYHKEDNLGQDIICNLASLNMVKSIEENAVEESIRTGMRALTFVANNSRIEHLPSVHKANKNIRAVGLGVMSFHSMCAKNQIRYGSEESLDLINVYCMMMDYYSLDESMRIAKERNDKFYGFETSDYAIKDKEYGEYFYKNNRVTEDVKPVTDKVKEIFKDIYIPTKEDWQRLAKDVGKYGLYNGYRLSVAPTQSISYITNCSSALTPVVDIVERRTYGNSETFYPMPYLSPQTMWYYSPTAFEIPNEHIINVAAVAQKWIDQGVSTILFVNSEIETNKLARLYAYAHDRGLKSLYYTRNKLLSIAECTSCAV
ncbi:class 1b ribonucleoside-diphosphate reductase subunit alpha [Staphylococcus delphini]|uniref:Ribonucleoside-diphosphate reductase n=1 Tax=Staphylococcus delphini TaxID=53344 RepID=A0AAX0QT66_9STAP|nr:class 1b ribonucleoside-diphosphate reductase subunit alpha [Staphylococcus delphini]PCF50066.1 ribonucleotide-diphosphate reductase subunit alpha [Staphylococcus delphini]PNZ95688.1 class 1b ribonucleoside-diphosphate reductase subunit alpha [Staphylococcus delphini]RIZ56302.1 ribonucleotide-diphosphate reductase subunit alpha [Staphylococcus delphini]VED62542.1 ribonucleoside-diphosphate reductase subunit alpha [Staphylococcus delphini]